MLKEALATTYLHFNRAKDNYEEIVRYTLNADIYSDKEKLKTLDAFIFRFIKLQDFMGDKLFREILQTVGEYKDNMSLMDCLDKLEKLEVIGRAELWLNYRILRNKLAHEYPDNQDDIIEGIKLAIVYFVEISAMLERISRYLQKKNLIDAT